MEYLVCENVVKIFGRRKPIRALDGLNLTVNEGEVIGLLGPNGSGKTTLVKCCLNIFRPTSGKITLFGRHPGHPETTLKIGYLPENPSFSDHLTGKEFLTYHAELARIPFSSRWKRISEVIEQVGLEPSAIRRKLRTYSKGMLQRIGLAQALLNQPKLIFLDEPQSGLDPIGRKQVRDIIKNIRERGATVLFSSHVLGDVEDVADRIAIIDKGKVLRMAALPELTLKTNLVYIRVIPVNGSPAIDEQKLLVEIKSCLKKLNADFISFSGGLLECTVIDERHIPGLISELVNAGIDIFEVKQEKKSLEESFIKEISDGK